jgi:hypothetical protein
MEVGGRVGRVATVPANRQGGLRMPQTTVPLPFAIGGPLVRSQQRVMSAPRKQRGAVGGILACGGKERYPEQASADAAPRRIAGAAADGAQ